MEMTKFAEHTLSMHFKDIHKYKIVNSKHEMSTPVYWENKKYITSLSSVEFAQRVITVNPGIPCDVDLL